jgi:apolipoprotein N-acyltransferase
MSLWKDKSYTWKKWVPDAFTFYSAVLITLAFPPWDVWPLAWICLIPWFAAIDRAPARKGALIQGFWMGFFMCLGVFYWVAIAVHKFGDFDACQSLIGLFVFCTVGEPHFFFFAPVFKKMRSEPTSGLNHQSLGIALFLAFTYTGIDWLLPKLFIDTLGHSLYRARNLRQLADVGGATLLTFLIVFVNYAVWEAIRVWKATRRLKISRPLLTAGFLCLAGFGYGFFRNQVVHAHLVRTSQGLQTAMIQTCTEDQEKTAAEMGEHDIANRIISQLSDWSRVAMRLPVRPEIMIWPETSYPSYYRNFRSSFGVKLDERVDLLSRELGVPILFGGYNHDFGKDYNSLLTLAPNGALQIYRKSILLPFGEYMPGEDTLPLVKKLFPHSGVYGRGPGPEILTLGIKGARILVGPIICYEALFSSFVIELARKGAQIIVNISNDSWFGTWGEPQLHLALSVFRSIETRLPMIRSANTGISALILPDGEITHSTRIGEMVTTNVFIPITPPIPTLMKLWGDWFGSFSLIMALLGGAAIAYRSKRQEQPKLKARGLRKGHCRIKKFLTQLVAYSGRNPRR